MTAKKTTPAAAKTAQKATDELLSKLAGKPAAKRVAATKKVSDAPVKSESTAKPAKVATSKPAVKKTTTVKATAPKAAPAPKKAPAPKADAPKAAAPGDSLAAFRQNILGKLVDPKTTKFKRKGPNQHEIIDEVEANLNADFRNKAARILEDSGMFTKVTYPAGVSALNMDETVEHQTRMAVDRGFQSIRDFVTLFPRIQGDTEDVIRMTALLAGKMPVTGRVDRLQKSFTLANQESINEIVMDLFEQGFYGAHDADDVVKYNEKNVPIFRASLSFSRKGNLSTRAVEVNIRYARDNGLVLEFLQLFRKHVAVSGSVDAGTYDTILNVTPAGLDIKSESLQDAQEANADFYPWMDGVDPATYINDFLESSANVLILYGKPGTGKTTLIRSAVKRLGLRALGSANSQLLGSSGFITACGTHMSGQGEGSRYDLLVAEDADIMCGKRSDGNMNMSLLLNAVDGVSKETSFKLIITTNKENLNDMDPALLRPGRCFDVMEFGRLTGTQAMTIRHSMGLPAKQLKPTNNYVLAEVLTMDKTKSQVVDGNALVSPRFPLLSNSKK